MILRFNSISRSRLSLYSPFSKCNSFKFATSLQSSFPRNFNLKFYFEYLLFNIPHLYVFYKLQFLKTNTLLISQLYAYFLVFHLRFSSLFYTTQLVDMFAYELPVNSSLQMKSNSIDPSFNSVSNTTVVYNFHNIRNHDRFFIFSPSPSSLRLQFPLHSISELYPNSNWLEREVSELHGIVFNGKKDLRNLMLQYGDTSTPFQKAYPSVGLKEVFYDSNTDLIVQLPVSLQV